jgi:hypothetical protein
MESIEPAMKQYNRKGVKQCWSCKNQTELSPHKKYIFPFCNKLGITVTGATSECEHREEREGV